MNLEKVTKKEFLNILGQSLTSVVDECFVMMSKVKEDPTSVAKYFDNMLTLLDSANHNASLYNRVECLDKDKNIYFIEKSSRIPVLKFSKEQKTESNNLYG